MGMGQSCAGCAGGDKDNQLVFGLSSRDAPAIEPLVDPLNVLGDDLFDDKVMSLKLPPAVMKRFQECLISGQPTSEEDMKVIAKIMFGWARERGCIDFAHWFFPTRGGGGAVGGMLGAYKQDTLIDLDFGSKFVTKPMKACLPHERLFQGETDGSSFPNGGLRVTHSAAAFTTWDRSSPPFVLNKTLYIPCAFITHFGKCIDEKTPLLRSMDAVKKEGLRLLKAADLGKNAQTIYSYLGWEQEFFVIKAEHYKARPDLVNTGRTLFGKLPTRHQQGDLNYFAPVPGTVQKLLDKVQTAMLQVGCPMAVKHNEVAPGQHEMSPVFRVANVSCDTNVLFMEVMNREAAKMGLQVLFHEKPFAGINGSGKHANWSIGTDTGLNFFYPGKTEEGAKLFVTGIACLAHGLAKYNELVRCSVATAGNDHRLGAQEAPPAIISLYPGQGFEQYVESVIAGGDLLGYKAEKKKQETGCSQAMHIEANVEDRNRTAPFPFCGNRFEFRAVGSSQNCNLPVMVCNAIMAAGMAHMAELIEKGSNHRDAVAAMFKENKHVIFTGNGYSDQWKQDAAKRGLPNLNTTPKALATWTEEKNQALFEKMGIYSREETNARQEVMYENYITALKIEADTMINMVDTGIVPACAKDLKKSNFSSKKTAAARKAAYEAIVQEADKLKAVVSKTEGPLAKEAAHLCDAVKPQMEKLRAAVDKAEALMESGLYPYPSYETMLPPLNGGGRALARLTVELAAYIQTPASFDTIRRKDGEKLDTMFSFVQEAELADERLQLQDLPHGQQGVQLLELPLPRAELQRVTALDLGPHARYLAVACEALLVVVPLLEVLLAHAPPGPLADRLAAARNEAEEVKAAWGSWALGEQMLADLFGGVTSASTFRFPVPSIQQDGDAVTSMRWWVQPGEPEVSEAQHHLLVGSLSGRLCIMDVASQQEVRTFSLAPIVWLQLCRYHCQEWLLIETTADPKHWKLLLAARMERPKEPALQWAITKGQALPTSSSEHFELEPLSMPALYMLLVVRRGANSERQDRSEVLGMLVDEAEGQEHPKLCLLLSLPSFPEDPLARIDLPIDAAAPGKSGNRRLMDLVPLSGGLFLSVIHGKNESFMTLSTAKPQPGGSEAPANQVVQELSVPGRVLGVAGALGAVAGVLAFFWTATEVFTLTATDVSKTLQEEVIRRASEADAEFDELPLLCWALDVDIDTLLLDAGRRILSGRWDHIGEQGVRTALALWARRSRPLEMPLLQLQECFSELAQHVELMHNLVPSILSLLMPHWPEVVARLDGLHGNHADEDAPPELANVAWFLSLVVMLLVVLHLRATAPPGEYKRGQEGLALRSWVSEQVPRIVGCRAPRSFQQLAEKVQADFDAWWAQEAEKAQSASPMTSMLASTFTAIEPKKTDFEEYEDLPAGCCSARLLLLGCLDASSLGGLARACGSQSAGLLVSLLLYGCELCEPPLLLAPSAALAASLLPELLRPGLGTEVIFRILWAIFGPCRPNSTRAAKPTVVNITVPEPLLAEFAELDESETEEARWMCFLCLLGQLAKGRCAECSHVWTFEQEPAESRFAAIGDMRVEP
ncbi:unnamed protein product [Effrenium voratum]|nr:unnamed protein product [Effrenium voratum]